MRNIHDRIRELFTFSKRERPGIILLCLLLVLTASLPLIFHGRSRPPDPMLIVRADSFFHAPVLPETELVHSASLFRFDPNTLTYSDWEKLGLQERTIRMILHYREKGGMFRRPEDLGRIWGLPPGEYDRLRPYVRIADSKTRTFDHDGKPLSAAPSSNSGPDTRRTFQHAYRRVEPSSLEVNQADSLQWLALPGIGEKLTSRILRFRERLGGFCTVDQVGETWGLPDSTFRKIRPLLTLSVASTRKIPLNTAPEDILQQHPYIRYKLARVIIRYRQEHGPFTAVEDLRRIALVTDDLYVRLEPYCSIN